MEKQSLEMSLSQLKQEGLDKAEVRTLRLTAIMKESFGPFLIENKND